MAYTVDQIKVFAYNYVEQPDFTVDEKNLFIGVAWCYEWYRAHPEDKDVCLERMNRYIDWFRHFTLHEI